MQLTLGRKKAPKHNSFCPEYGNKKLAPHHCYHCERLSKPKQRYHAVAADLLGER